MKVEDQRIDLCSLIHVYALGLCQFALMYTSVRKNSHSNEPQNWQLTGSVYFVSQVYV